MAKNCVLRSLHCMGTALLYYAGNQRHIFLVVLFCHKTTIPKENANDFVCKHHIATGKMNSNARERIKRKRKNVFDVFGEEKKVKKVKKG